MTAPVPDDARLPHEAVFAELGYGARSDDTWPPTRDGGLHRLTAFLPRAGGAYARDRNIDRGPARRENVSMLSPYLRHRLVTEDEAIAAVIDAHGLDGGRKFVEELFWRTYWKGWLELRPDVWARFLAERDAERERAERSAALRSDVQAAETGRTGIEAFDSWARELTTTGYLHNHARMWFASIWIFTLGLPWTLGADFFLRHLVDADPASNTLSWRWVGGLQTVGKCYLATAENIARCTEGRFQPTGLARMATPLEEPALPAPRALPSLPRLTSAVPALLLVTGEDLHPESLVRADETVCGAVVARGATPSLASRADRFVRAAAPDVATRVAEHYGCATPVVDTIDTEALIATAEQAGVRAIVTAYAPVGPMADTLRRLSPTLAAAGLPLYHARRPIDELAWPLATRGFFPFRAAIPDLVRQLGIRA